LRDSLPIDMLLSAVSVLVIAQSSSEVPEGLMNNPVLVSSVGSFFSYVNDARPHEPEASVLDVGTMLNFPKNRMLSWKASTLKI